MCPINCAFCADIQDLCSKSKAKERKIRKYKGN